MFSFHVDAQDQDGQARVGRMRTLHGEVRTPVFMPVGTHGSVKSLSPEDLRSTGAEVILANAYHLYLRPGHECIRELGGLHRFMSWDGVLLTDSGGFQVFSLSGLREIDSKGVTFRSHIDGSLHYLTPGKVIEIQESLGSDIMMCLDECIPYPADRLYAERSAQLTREWAMLSLECRRREGAALFGIAQGGMFEDLRRLSARHISELDFDGYAIGGLSVGEDKELMYHMTSVAVEEFPRHRPRYLMGVGSPEDILNCVDMGVDMFDCVLPTRNARNGMFYTSEGRLVIKNARYRADNRPVDPECDCYTCRNFSRSYLRHLFLSKELLVYRLNTLHNVYFYIRLMQKIREAIYENYFSGFKTEFLHRLSQHGGEDFV